MSANDAAKSVKEPGLTQLLLRLKEILERGDFSWLRMPSGDDVDFHRPGILDSDGWAGRLRHCTLPPPFRCRMIPRQVEIIGAAVRCVWSTGTVGYRPNSNPAPS